MATDFEHRVNTWRGYCCLLITVMSISIVLTEPWCLLFWKDYGYRLNIEHTGLVGFATSAFFGLYLLVDTIIGLVYHRRFRRSMNAVFLHHAVVGAGVAAFLLPSPPRGFFLYVWGEALTACRLLPLRPRWHARSAVFAFRRVLWSYLCARDCWYFGRVAALYGMPCAAVPPGVAVLLLALDRAWWREHARSGARAAKQTSGFATTSDEESGGLCSGRVAAPVTSRAGGTSNGVGAGAHSTASEVTKSSLSVHLDAPLDSDEELEGLNTP